jgi:predicted metal-dependent enzyme (double-stranded beta helix superfamily)
MSAILKLSSEPVGIARLRDFIVSFGALLDSSADESTILERGPLLLKKLIRVDDWLPSAYAESDGKAYRQYLLHADSRERFSVVSFVFGPGQTTPIHDHTVWGLIGLLRGSEQEQHYILSASGGLVEEGTPHILNPGEVDSVSPRTGDIHRVSNAITDRASVSIHVYGANIGAVRRSTYELSGEKKSFISGYSNTEFPSFLDNGREKN